jgi:hypothetical protein
MTVLSWSPQHAKPAIWLTEGQIICEVTHRQQNCSVNFTVITQTAKILINTRQQRGIIQGREKIPGIW